MTMRELYKMAKWFVADNRDMADNLAELWDLMWKDETGWVMREVQNSYLKAIDDVVMKEPKLRRR